MEDKESKVREEEENENNNTERFIKELSEYEHRFTSLLANVKLCTVLLNRERKIMFVNNYLLERTGYTSEEILNQDWLSFIPEEKRDQMKNILNMIFNGMSEVLGYIEYEIATKDGGRIEIGWNNTLLKDVKNNIVGLNSIGEDLTMKSDNNSLTPLPVSNEVQTPKLVISGNNFTGETLGEYILVKSLGGDNSQVKLAVHKTTKERVAVKTLKKATMTEQELTRAQREIDIMRQLTQLDNPYIIKLLDFIETSEEFHIFLEYVSGGELVALILKNKGLNEVHTHKLFLQILSAIRCCHSNKIIHRDIKLQNILLDHNRNIKLIDFGLSNFTQEGVFRDTFCGTPAYASPEILLGNKYSGPEVDLWSLGVVLYAMLTSEFPFTTISDILKGKFKEPTNVTQECVDLLQRVLRVNKDERETLQGVLDHPWINMTSEQLESKLSQRNVNSMDSGRKLETKEVADEPSIKKRKTSSDQN